MVTITAAHQREGEKGKFVSLELQGDLELVQSLNTGRFYATTRKAFISSTFDLKTANHFVGKQLPGSIVRVESDPYEFTVPETNEVITLAHTYTYIPETKQAVAAGQPALAFS